MVKTRLKKKKNGKITTSIELDFGCNFTRHGTTILVDFLNFCLEKAGKGNDDVKTFLKQDEVVVEW